MVCANVPCCTGGEHSLPQGAPQSGARSGGSDPARTRTQSGPPDPPLPLARRVGFCPSIPHTPSVYFSNVFLTPLTKRTVRLICRTPKPAQDCNMDEIWKPYPDFPEHYAVSNRGRVRRNRTGRILKPARNTNGYWMVVMCVNGKSHPRTVHRVVAETFLGPRPEMFRSPWSDVTIRAVVSHVDGCPDNNAADNLCYETQAANIHRAQHQHGTFRTRHRT